MKGHGFSTRLLHNGRHLLRRRHSLAVNGHDNIPGLDPCRPGGIERARGGIDVRHGYHQHPVRIHFDSKGDSTGDYQRLIHHLDLDVFERKQPKQLECCLIRAASRQRGSPYRLPRRVFLVGHADRSRQPQRLPCHDIELLRRGAGQHRHGCQNQAA